MTSSQPLAAVVPPHPTFVCHVASLLATPRSILQYASAYLRQRVEYSFSDTADLPATALVWRAHARLDDAYLRHQLAEKYGNPGSRVEAEVADATVVVERDAHTTECLVELDRVEEGVVVAVFLHEGETAWRFHDVRVLSASEWSVERKRTHGESQLVASSSLPVMSYLSTEPATTYHFNDHDDEEEDDDDDDYWNAYSEFDASPAPARPAASTKRRISSPPPAPRADSPPLLPAPISPPPAPAAPAPAPAPAPTDSTPAKAMATSIGHALHFLSFNDAPAPATNGHSPPPTYGVSRDAIKEHVVASATSLWMLAARSGMAKEEFLAVVAAAVYSPQ
ncbi:hypothetical protein AMAG_02826 [Allomyces macrogynus ATCC 38327]|uniref:Uncharacterized protein n=1 Tax=Allomyces macrogynus (strain ATCC 38327) TaxID=578462 RepID=A0A0L0S3U2_ALLM3|nr:hypothetical protein AMAG_02826 [Allomyces macrogynus ATCC 38327]|eukprot:KNE57071.1 hypothetical protein AMAG_02826 [Allomyces macrogynus ATCC 38327]